MTSKVVVVLAVFAAVACGGVRRDQNDAMLALRSCGARPAMDADLLAATYWRLDAEGWRDCVKRRDEVVAVDGPGFDFPHKDSQ